MGSGVVLTNRDDGLVLRGAIPLLRSLQRPKFHHDNPVRTPVSFERLGLAAANDKPAPIERYRVARVLLVLSVCLRILHHASAIT